MMLSVILPLLLAATPPSTPAPAPTQFAAADIADAQCFAAIGFLMSDKDKSSMIASVYFYAKIIGRNPSVDLEGLLRAVAEDSRKNAAAYGARCAPELEAMGDKLEKAGLALGNGN